MVGASQILPRDDPHVNTAVRFLSDGMSVLLMTILIDFIFIFRL